MKDPDNLLATPSSESSSSFLVTSMGVFAPLGEKITFRNRNLQKDELLVGQSKGERSP